MTPTPIALAMAAFTALAATGSARAAEYATVVAATPVTATVSVPRQQCIDTQQVVPARTSGGGSLLGAIAGGVIGNTIGHGFGRAAATGIGVVAGSAIGNNLEANANGGYDTVPVRRCSTVGTVEQRVVGYDVTYDYAGQRYTTRMANPPGARIAIDVRPQGEPATRYSTARPVYGAVPLTAAPNDGSLPPTYGTALPVYGQAPVVEPAAYVGPPVVYVQPAYGYGYRRGWGYGRWH